MTLQEEIWQAIAPICLGYTCAEVAEALDQVKAAVQASDYKFNA